MLKCAVKQLYLTGEPQRNQFKTINLQCPAFGGIPLLRGKTINLKIRMDLRKIILKLLTANFAFYIVSFSLCFSLLNFLFSFMDNCGFLLTAFFTLSLFLFALIFISSLFITLIEALLLGPSPRATATATFPPTASTISAIFLCVNPGQRRIE